MKRTAVAFPTAVAVCFVGVTLLACALPGAGAAVSAVAYAAILAAALGLLHVTGNDSAAARTVTLVSATLSVVLVIINVNYFTAAAGRTAADPLLQNYDAMRDWNWACHMVFGDPEPDSVISGMSFVTAGILWVFGRSVAYPIFFVSLCYAVTIVMIGSIARQLTGRRDVGLAAMIIGALMCYLLAHSSVLVKDLLVTCMFSIVIDRMIASSRRGSGFSLRDVAVMIPALAVLLVARHNMSFMLAVGCLLFMIGAGVSTRLSLLAIAAAALVGGQIVNRMLMPWPDDIMNTVTSDECAKMILTDDATRPWDNIVGDYTMLPFYIKLLWLPVSVAIQFLLPFPWGFERHVIFGPGVAVAHISYFWYLAGALIIYWIFGCAYRAPRRQQLTVVWGVILTVITAYMSSGRISRYCLPYLPLLLPAAAIVALDCRRHRSLWIWLAVFAALLLTALLICYSMQHPS